jgi:hypothetical protein
MQATPFRGLSQSPSPSDHASLSPEILAAARLQGRAWAAAGQDIKTTLRRHSPHWGRNARERVCLVAAVLQGWKEGGKQ